MFADPSGRVSVAVGGGIASAPAWVPAVGAVVTGIIAVVGGYFADVAGGVLGDSVAGWWRGTQTTTDQRTQSDTMSIPMADVITRTNPQLPIYFP